MQTIPTVAEQVALATRVHAALGNSVLIDGRWYRVVRNHWDVRFFGQAKFRGENPPYAIVDVLRHDLARATTLPCEYQDRKLAAICERIVTATLAGLS